MRFMLGLLLAVLAFPVLSQEEPFPKKGNVEITVHGPQGWQIRRGSGIYKSVDGSAAAPGAWL